MRRLRSIIIALVFVLLFTGIGVYKYLSSRTLYNEVVVNGNTPGNLFNGGLFCEKNGVVYFANPKDDDALYQMSLDESNYKKVCDDKVFYINADPNYIYYSRNKNNDESQMAFLNVSITSLCRIDIDGKNIKIFDDDVCSNVALCQNDLYYIHNDKETASSLYTVKIDGKDKKPYDTGIDPSGIVQGKLYYSGVVSDHYLHSKDLFSGVDTVVSMEWVWQPYVMNNNAFFMDLNDSNKIAVLNLSDGSKETLSTYGASTYNVQGNYIYYQSIKGNPDGIYCVDISNNTEQLIMEGQFNSINTTSRYVYFRDYFSGQMYHVAVGSNNAAVFNPDIELKN